MTPKWDFMSSVFCKFWLMLHYGRPTNNLYKETQLLKFLENGQKYGLILIIITNLEHLNFKLHWQNVFLDEPFRIISN